MNALPSAAAALLVLLLLAGCASAPVPSSASPPPAGRELAPCHAEDPREGAEIVGRLTNDVGASVANGSVSVVPFIPEARALVAPSGAASVVTDAKGCYRVVVPSFVPKGSVLWNSSPKGGQEGVFVELPEMSLGYVVSTHALDYRDANATSPTVARGSILRVDFTLTRLAAST